MHGCVWLHLTSLKNNAMKFNFSSMNYIYKYLSIYTLQSKTTKRKKYLPLKIKCERSHKQCCKNVSVNNQDKVIHSLLQWCDRNNIHPGKPYLKQNHRDEWLNLVEHLSDCHCDHHLIQTQYLSVCIYMSSLWSDMMLCFALDVKDVKRNVWGWQAYIAVRQSSSIILTIL